MIRKGFSWLAVWGRTYPPAPLMVLFPPVLPLFFLLQLNLTYETNFTLGPSQKYHI